MRQYGLAAVNLTGVWRADSGALFRIVDKDKNPSIELLESRDLASLQASLRRVGPTVVADQWIVTLTRDPAKTAHNLKLEFRLNSEGLVRVKSEPVGADSRSKSTKLPMELGLIRVPDEEYAKLVAERERVKKEQDTARTKKIAGVAAVTAVGLVALHEMRKWSEASAGRAAAPAASGQPAAPATGIQRGDKVCNTGFFRHWSGTVISVDGNLCHVRIDYSDNETLYPPKTTRDFFDNELKLRTSVSVSELLHGG
jgi:hypothetical protein